MKSSKTNTATPVMEVENSHMNVDDTNSKHSSTELIERSEITGTPFTMVKWEQKYYVCMGRHRLSEPKDTLEEAQIDALREDWERMMQVMGIMIENYNK